MNVFYGPIFLCLNAHVSDILFYAWLVWHLWYVRKVEPEKYWCKGTRKCIIWSYSLWFLIAEQIDQVHTESLDELTCPLCGMRFESKTGLSNHVRGHLKRLGKAYSTTTIRSPLDILKQLMSKKEEFQKTVQAFHKRHSTSKKHSRNDPFLLSITSVAKKYLNCCEPLAEGGDKNNRFEITDSGKCSPSSDLIGMLKKRKSHGLKSTNHTTRKALALPLQHSDFLSGDFQA